MSLMKDLRDSLVYRRARKRLDRVSKQQTLMWANSAVWSTQAFLEAYQKDGIEEALDETRTALVGLLAAVDSLVDKAGH